MLITNIETKRLDLRPFTREDAYAASINSRQPKVAFWMQDMILNNEEDAIKWIDWINEKCQASELFRVFAIERKEDNVCIGLIGYAPKAEINNEIEILFAIADPFQGYGYAPEAAKALIWYAFEKQGLAVISAIIKPENTSSRKVIEKLGFVYGDSRRLNYNGNMADFDYYRLYHIEHIPDADWNFNCNVEEMSEFFDARADGYDSHMLKRVADIECYKCVAESIPVNSNEMDILDIGCGTGIELEYLLNRVPKAKVTCIDMSEKMLELLKDKYSSKAQQIHTICGSYIGWEYPQESFDYVVSSFTLHHFMEDVKAGIYRNIVSSLKPGGLYIESDFIVDRMMMEQYMQRYFRITKELVDKRYSGYYHIDIPFTIDLQKELLLKAGFSHVSVFHEDIKPEGSHAVLIARK
ncbi:MAG: bifunctional GNAT family N-acetyltransferase/class I SAM-dependent methyltransferase [Clostridia bacterium]|nr:bifunctional GNAT family N-acetyltransferase/class I SAM-dependent methyltransferase [Clostridia bacterium]